MKLNLGSGPKYRNGWVNVDLYAERCDVRADLLDFDCAAESVDEVLLVHTIEHLSRADAESLLSRIYWWLRPQGVLVIEAPDRLKCERLARNGKLLKGVKGLMGGRSVDKVGWHQWLTEVYAADRSTPVPDKWNLPGEAHLYVWDATELAIYLGNVGFRAVTQAEPQHHGRQKARDFRLEAVK